MSEPAPALPVQVTDLVKRYRAGWLRRPHTALRGVSFEVGAGEVVGLIGPNGGGKTTTFGCVLGLLRPTSGTVRLFGEPPGRPHARRHLGFLPESSPFPGTLTARQGLHFYGGLAGLARAERRRRAGELLERVGLHHAADRRLGVFSKGMLRRFGLAQALVGAPRLLLLDEPASGLDPPGARDLGEVIAAERASGTSVLVASHDLTALEPLCDRYLLLSGGRVALSISRHELHTQGRSLSEVFFDALAGTT
jgi:ABC-2 type transport system ATP-binding protein